MNKSLCLLLAPMLGLALTGAADTEAGFTIALPAAVAEDASGRLLLFVEPATPRNSAADAVDVGGPDDVSVAAIDVERLSSGHTVVIPTSATAAPGSLASLAPGEYRIQVVLDRDGSYNYTGRSAGDLVSNVETVRLPLAASASIVLARVVPPAPPQFDVAGLPPRAGEQITASRPHMHDEHIASKALTRFVGADRSISAWVLTPPGYDPAARTTYPTVYTAGGFGTNHRVDGQQLSKIWHLMETGIIPPMIWVSLDYATRTGTTEFADSPGNGPWGEALVKEVIPTLERKYRMDAKPSGRFLTGHSSGGWFALWTIVRHPEMFGGAWATSPDPVDFRSFLGVDLYAPLANMYRDAEGRPRPLERDEGKIVSTIEQSARLETVLGYEGGQLRSFDWTFSPRRADGTPAFMFDRESGAINPDVVAHWRARYDIGHRIEADWPRLRRHLDGKVHVTVGAVDSYYLDGAVHRLDAAFRKVGGRADFTFVPNATHSEAQVYARGQDRNALWKEMTSAMYDLARPRTPGAGQADQRD